MKFWKFFFSASLLLVCVTGYSCGPYFYRPEEYYIYRAYNGEEKAIGKSQRERNIESWLLLYPLLDKNQIEEVVYRWDLSKLEDIKKNKSKNTFARALSDRSDDEVIDYLIIAKKCENACAARASKWYYPFKNDPEISILDSVILKSRNYHNERLFDRYTLQAVRAMFSLSRYEDILSLWKTAQPHIPEGIIREMIIGYVAGATFRTGDQDKAIEYFLRIGDLESVKYCAAQKGVNHQMLPSYILSLYSDKCPDSPDIPRLLQETFYGFEDDWEDMSDYYRWTEMNYKERRDNRPPRGNVKATLKYYDICMKAVEKSKSPAVWYYTAAYLQDLLGNSKHASTLLARAEKTNHDKFLGESIQVFRIYLDAQTSVYDSSYETKLFEQLKWLDKKITSSICDNVITKTSEEPYYMSCGFSYYYWNDMLRKIVISEVCPRMEDAGKSVMSLRLLNMADNRLVGFINKRVVSWYRIEQGEYKSYSKTESMTEYRNDTEHSNDHDYSNYFFNRLDEIAIQTVIRYANSIAKPSTKFERFLDERSYCDKDYLFEIIGTRYLRARKYERAVYWLSKVSEGYQEKTNVKWYMTRDPFVLESPLGYFDKGYKLAFAQEMLSLQNKSQSNNPDIRGKALVKMGTGLRSSFTNCWALTQYHKYYDDDWITSNATIAAIKLADEMIKEGLHTIKDPEIAAAAYLSQYLYLSVAEKYPQTTVCKKMKAECDKLYDHKQVIPKNEE